MQTAALWEIGLTNVYRSRSAREPFQHRGSRGVARESFLSRPRLGFRDLVPKVAAKRSPIERGRAIRKQRILQQPCTLFSLSLSLSLVYFLFIYLSRLFSSFFNKQRAPSAITIKANYGGRISMASRLFVRACSRQFMPRVGHEDSTPELDTMAGKNNA
jgi:hypothetical protein